MRDSLIEGPWPSIRLSRIFAACSNSWRNKLGHGLKIMTHDFGCDARGCGGPRCIFCMRRSSGGSWCWQICAAVRPVFLSGPGISHFQTKKKVVRQNAIFLGQAANSFASPIQVWTPGGSLWTAAALSMPGIKCCSWRWLRNTVRYYVSFTLPCDRSFKKKTDTLSLK